MAKNKPKVAKFQMPVLDYSTVPQTPHTTLADDTWEPPEHKYFGKKRADGKLEKEPPYVHKAYPKMLYRKNAAGVVEVTQVNTEEEHDALPKGWGESLAELGVITCPSFEQMHGHASDAADDDDEDEEKDEEDQDDEDEEDEEEEKAPVVAKAVKKTRRQPASRK